MLGAFRALLAILVAMGHIFGPPTVGHYMVFAFYIISGYLMTLIMQETYHYTTRGQKAFVINRFLRLYPQYFLALLLTAICILVIGESNITSGFHRDLYLPKDIVGWASNIGLAFLHINPAKMDPRMVPPAWALTVEIFFYCCICLGLSRNRRRVYWWLALSLGFHVLSLLNGVSHSWRYASIPAASLPFSMGALIYFLQRDKQVPAWLDDRRHNTWFYAWLFNIGLAFALYYYFLPAQPELAKNLRETCFYLNLLFVFLFVLSAIYNARGLPVVREGLDKKLGDYSYPVYLYHYIAALVVSYTLFGFPYRGFDMQGIQVFALALPTVFLISALSLKLIDANIQVIRNRKKSALARQQGGVK